MKSLVKDPWFLIIASLALALRVWHLWHAQHSPTFWAPAVDPLWYHQAAERVAHGFYGPWPLFRAPLYPVLLGWLYKFVQNDLLWARLLNIALQLTTLWVLYAVAARYFNTLAARVAALLFAVNGMAIYFCGEILSTSLEMLVAALAAWSSLALRKSPTLRQAAVCGLLWGLAAITRPNFLMVAPFALLFALWPVSGREVRRAALASLIALFVPVLPVTLANWSLGGEPVLIATQGGVNFWIGNNPQADGVTSSLPGADRFWTMEQAELLAESESGQDLTPKTLSDHYYAKGWAFLRDNPGAGLRLMLRKTSLYFNQFEISNNKHIAYFSRQTPGLPPLILLNFALLLPLAMLGLWSSSRKEARLLWGLVLVYAASVILFFISSRFRMPAVPWLCLLSGAGVTAFATLLNIARIKAAVAAIAVLALALMNPFQAREAPIASARYMEGNAHLALGQLDSARACFVSALEDPELRKLALLNLGVTEQRANRLLDAKVAYTRLVRDFPEFPEGWNNLGVVAEAQRDTNSALEAYRRALSIHPDFSDARENLARLLFEMGKSKLRLRMPWAALEPLEASVNTLPTAQGYYHLALAYGQTNESEKAIQTLELALKLNPDYDLAVTLKRQLELNQAGASAPWPVIK